MKKYLLLAAALSTTLFSCDDSLDRLPVDQLVPETAYQTVSDLEFGLSGIYSAYTVGGILAINSIMTDNTKIGADSGGQQVNLFNLQISAGNGLDQGIFLSRYRIANRASRVLEAAELLEPTEEEMDEYNYYLAQAYGMRALAHYEALIYYTPDLLDPNGVAVPYVDFVVLDEFPGRNTVQEVKTGILNDIAAAESLIGNNSSVDRVNPDFLTFLRARLELVTGNYPAAITLSNELIAKYPLADQQQYFGMFLDEDNTEVIFKKVLTQSDARIAGAWYFTGTGGAFIEMSNSLFNELNFTDVRTFVLLDQDSDVQNNEHLINKYPGSGGIDFMNDFKAMRISEIHLIKAEAHARQDEYLQTAGSLKMIRDARFGINTPQDVYGSRTEALRAVLEERRLELAYEGHRYVDLKRFRFDLNEGLNRDPLDCVGAAPCQLAPNDHRFTLPIPQVEVDSNPNITENNPGY